MTDLVRGLFRARPVRFLAVGGGAALFLFGLTYTLVSLAGLPPFIGTVLAYGMAVMAAYSAQRSWTFGGAHRHGHALPRYLVLQLVCALFSGVVSHVAMVRLGMTPLPMSALTTLAASAASYVVSSAWVFPLRD